jgi:MFS family permease
MAVTLVVAGMQQFYFLGSAPFMQSIGIPGKNISAVMAIAQVVQALATWWLMDYFYGDLLGYNKTLALGLFCWAILFLTYVQCRKPSLIVPIQAFHGFAYVFFMIVGQIYTGAVAPKEMGGAAQGLIFFVQAGLSLFLCTQLAGFVMDKFSTDGKFHWNKIFAVPLVCAALGGVVLLVAMKNPEPKPEVGNSAAEKQDGQAKEQGDAQEGEPDISDMDLPTVTHGEAVSTDPKSKDETGDSGTPDSAEGKKTE